MSHVRSFTVCWLLSLDDLIESLAKLMPYNTTLEIVQPLNATHLALW